MRIASIFWIALSICLTAPSVSGASRRATTADPRSGQSRSPVLKDPSGPRSPFYLRVDRSTEALFDAFMLVKKANGGDAQARHELGLRYLQGDGFPADTVKAAYWIGRSAEQDFTPAIYNLGILMHNGWGTDWDPFTAYRNFRLAAGRGMPEGMYMTGILLTDNLVTARDHRQARRWLSASADSGYEAAAEALRDFERLGVPPETAEDERRKSAPSRGRGSASDWKPVFLDLGTDTLADPDDSTLAREAGEAGAGPSIEAAADAGSPEALTLLGRRYDAGIGTGPDPVEAAFHYLRAIRSESRWAPVLLWRLSSGAEFRQRLEDGAGRKNRKAEYVWASLVARGFDRRLTTEQALGLLRTAATAGLADAAIELAMWHYAGLAVAPNAAVGDSLMAAAAALGSREARIGMMLSLLRSPVSGGGGAGVSLDSLRAWESQGSVLAQVMLGYCHERGIGGPPSVAQAVAQYRSAARRGSRLAYDALRALYDGRRPPDSEFAVDED